MLREIVLGCLVVLSAAHAALAAETAGAAEPVRIRKTDFPRFLGVVACGPMAGAECPGAADGFAAHGLTGDPGAPDPEAADLAAGGPSGRIAVGFLEGKPFTWTRYAVEYPNSGWKWVVLNQVSSGEQNHVLLTLWRHTGATLDLARIFTTSLPLALGETTVQGRATLPDGSLLVVLKGDGADAGVRLQDFRFLRLSGQDRMQEVHRRTNRSEIPVVAIMDRLNADQPVEAVLDSTLSVEVGKRKAPSGGPLVRFTVTRNRVLYTKAGPEETLEGRSTEDLDIWKAIQARKTSR